MKNLEHITRSLRYVAAFVVIIVLIVTIVTVVERTVPTFHDPKDNAAAGIATVDQNSTNSSNHTKRAVSPDCVKKREHVPLGANC
ncbi:hypothetical protein BGZ96_010948 [Linnemannia gamsii]|uniref:Uncharacterized protein n=1 Tax=Linnemannia gamsii TaxID=64522 RepID=A0ABQ7JTC6_9FUNG|nr:hypothetical protein BGZ96_010948 [Linnemannia gamsii]